LYHTYFGLAVYVFVAESTQWQLRARIMGDGRICSCHGEIIEISIVA